MNLHCLWLTPHAFYTKQKPLRERTHFLISHHFFNSLRYFHIHSKTKFLLMICEGQSPPFIDLLPFFFPALKFPRFVVPKSVPSISQQEGLIQGIHHSFCVYFRPQMKTPVLQNNMCIPLLVDATRHFVSLQNTVLLRPVGQSSEECWLHLEDLKAVRLQIPLCWLAAQCEPFPFFYQFRSHHWVNLNHLERIERITSENHMLYFSNQQTFLIKSAEKHRILNQIELLGQKHNRQHHPEKSLEQ